MNRREALSAVGAAGLTAAFGIGRAAADPVPGDSLPPAVTMTDAITIAEAHLKAEKVATAGHYLSSARLVKEKGKLRWELRWDGTDRLAKGGSSCASAWTRRQRPTTDCRPLMQPHGSSAFAAVR